jgi:pyridoxine/pyridoxamine 5'-phosphate oxidase
MTVATVDVTGYPEARMILLKGVDEGGSFFTRISEAPKHWR